MVTTTAPFTSGSISRAITPLTQPVIHAPNLPPRPVLKCTFIMAGCRKTPSNSSRNSNSGQLPSTTLTNGESDGAHTLPRSEILRWSWCNSRFGPWLTSAQCAVTSASGS